MMQTNKQIRTMFTLWPQNEEQFIIGSFTDGIFPGEVMEVIADTVRADFLVSATVLKMEKDDGRFQRLPLSELICISPY